MADGPIARAEAARLEEARLAATEERVDADLACGRHAELIAELDALTRAHPLRERLWGQRMLALYRSGRQVEASGPTVNCGSSWPKRSASSPSPALAALETAILQQAPQLEWRPAAPPELPVQVGRARPAVVAAPIPRRGIGTALGVTGRSTGDDPVH